MNIVEAAIKIEERLLSLSSPLKEMGFSIESRILYADKNLQEYTEFTPKCIIVFGDIAIGNEELERDEYCNYSICVEVKTGLVDELELEGELNTLEGEIEAFKEKLEKFADGKEMTAKDYSPLIKEINAIQEKEAEAAAVEFTKDVNKTRIKILIGFGIIIVIILAVIIGIPLLT